MINQKLEQATHSYSKSQGLTTQLDLTAPISGEFGVKPVDKKDSKAAI